MDDEDMDDEDMDDEMGDEEMGGMGGMNGGGMGGGMNGGMDDMDDDMGGGMNGGMDDDDMDDMDDESGIKSLNKNMAGMGGVMRYFETPYGFDRAAFEDAIIQFQDYQDSGGDLGFHDFVVNEFLGIVKKEDKAPSIKMASETPEEEFDMMMESEILGEFDEYKKNNLLNGVDEIALTLKNDDKILDYENKSKISSL